MWWMLFSVCYKLLCLLGHWDSCTECVVFVRALGQLHWVCGISFVVCAYFINSRSMSLMS